MSQEKWKLRTFDNIDYSDINAGLLLQEMLKARGIENPDEWMNVSKEHENPPHLLKNIDVASKMLCEAMQKNKKIYIQVD